MKITFHPQFSDDPLTVFKQGDKLTINDEVFDFSVIPDGATLPATAVSCRWVIHDVERVGGILHLALLLPMPFDAVEIDWFPGPLFNPADGLLELPQ